MAARDPQVSPVYPSGPEQLDRTEQDRDVFTDLASKMDAVTSPVVKFRTVLSASGGNFIVQLLA